LCEAIGRVLHRFKLNSSIDPSIISMKAKAFSMR